MEPLENCGQKGCQGFFLHVLRHFKLINQFFLPKRSEALEADALRRQFKLFRLVALDVLLGNLDLVTVLRVAETDPPILEQRLESV